MIFKLNPSSGFANSYFDVQFTIVLESPMVDSYKIKIFNDTSKERLDILGVSTGRIINGNEIISKNSIIEGHINIFNQDKMNNKFKFYSKVNIRCELEYNNNQENEIVEFYNESKSLDAEVIPFDIIIKNHEIDFSQNQPLQIDIISGLAKSYELCIRSLDGSVQSAIEISSSKGKTSILIPSEFLYADLNLSQNKRKKFQFYYVKFEGTNYSKMANRQYIPIDKSELNFINLDNINPNPQVRIDPVGNVYDNNFVISDRYLVLCPRQYSGFAPKSEYGLTKLMDLTMLTNEAQHMESLSKQMKQFSAKQYDASMKIKNTEKNIHNSKRAPIRPRINVNQFQMMKNLSGVYDNISIQQSKLIPPAASTKIIQSFSAPPANKAQKGCLPCSRKKQKKNA